MSGLNIVLKLDGSSEHVAQVWFKMFFSCQSKQMSQADQNALFTQHVRKVFWENIL